MNKNQTYETVFETIKESTSEWAMEEDGKTYAYWVDGVIALADSLIDKINEEKNCRLVEG